MSEAQSTVIESIDPAIITTVPASDVSADVLALDAMLGDELDLDSALSMDVLGGEGEILEAPVDDLDAALGEVTIAEAKMELYQQQSEELEKRDAEEAAKDAPKTDADAVVVKGEAKPKKERKPVAPKEKKEPRPTFVTHDKSEILLHRVGEKRELLNLELTDFALPPEEQLAKQKALLEDIDKNTAKKVAEKALMVFAGKSSTQTVIKIAFETLARDGYLTSGNEGNLHKALLAKPFSQGTAASQGNQIFCLFPLLKIAVKSKGRLDPNPNSTILAQTLTELGLTLKTAE